MELAVGEMRSGNQRYLHRLRPRSVGAPADRGAAAGAAVGTRAYLAADRHGRDGLRPCARAEPAALGDRELPQGSQRLHSGRSDPKIVRLKEALDKAAEQALRAGEIIRRLRDFVARGETEMQVESLTKLVEEASALALVGAKQHGVRVTLRPRSRRRPGLCRQGAGAAGAAQPNAERHRGNGRGRIVAARDHRSRPQWRDSDMVEISVADTGPGIAPEIADAAVPAVHNDQAAGNGGGLVDFAHDRRRRMAASCGWSPIRAAGACSALRCALHWKGGPGHAG